MDPVLIEPVVNEWKARVPFLKGEMAELAADPEANWERIKELAETDRGINCMVRTTTAATMAKGSDQANILPEHASIITNSRLLPGQTLEDLEAHFAKVMPEGVNFRLVKGHNPPAISTTDSYGYRLIQKVVLDMYPDTTFIPSMLSGGTDSRFYCDVTPTKSVYRFTGMMSDPKTGGAHQVNEHINTAIIPKNVEFYVRLFQGYGDAE